MNEIFKGATDVTRYVMMVDSATGAPETGLTITNFDLQYTRNRSTPAAKVDATALAATNSAHGDNQAIEIDATSSPGLYRVDWPDAAFATGADKVLLVVTCAGCAPAVEYIELVNVNNQVAYVPNAAADAAGGLPISDAGGLDLDSIKTDTAAILADTGTDGVVVAAASKTGYTLTATTGLGNQTANITGNLSGSVGSVTGAVGSVTGNVGGNVVGTVAGVTPATAAQVAAVLTTQITEAYRANGAAPTLAEFMSEVLAHLGETSISGTTKTIKKFDHSTSAETFTLDDATNPSSITRAS